MLSKIIKMLSIAILLLSVSEARPSGKNLDKNTSSEINIDEENNNTKNSKTKI